MAKVTVPVPNGKSYGSGSAVPQHWRSKNRVTARAGQLQEQGDRKSRATARAGRQQEQGDSKSRVTA
jgi:hypothetical protein